MIAQQDSVIVIAQFKIPNMFSVIQRVCINIFGILRRLEWAIASHGKGTCPGRKVADVDIKCQFPC